MHDASHVARGRAFGPGRVAAFLLPLALAAACSGSSHHAKDSFGGYPSFLPKDTVKAGLLHQVVDASVAKPALATQGDTVRVTVPGAGTVLVNVTGPEVPNEGLSDQFETSPATFAFTLSHATKTVPLDPATFEAIDQAGAVYTLQPVPHQAPIPTSVAPGSTVSFKLRTESFSVGEGRMRWIPSGHLAPVEWDFVVEDD